MREHAQTFKSLLSSDCSLKFESMKQKSLVIAGDNTAVNIFSSFAHTARHAPGVDQAVRITHACCLCEQCVQSGLRQGWQLGRSRNKVVVGEPVAG